MMSKKVQLVGDTMSIGGGNDEMLDTFKAGTVQSFAEDANLKRSSNPIGVFTDQSMGQVEWVGDKMSMNRKAHRGYESGTPINMQDENPDTGSSY